MKGGFELSNLTNLLAHYDIDNIHRKQPLLEHLINVATKSKELGNLVGIGNSSQLIGLLHDFGKNSPEFQVYIKGAYNGRVNHSSEGAIILDNIQESVIKEYDVPKLLKKTNLKIGIWDLYKEILQYPILAHHGLYDIIDSNFEYRTGIRLHLDALNRTNIRVRDKQYLDIIDKNYRELNDMTINELYYEGFKEFIIIYKKIMAMAPQAGPLTSTEEKRIKAKSLHFYYGSLARLMLSILKEADIYDSSNYFRKEKDKIYSQEELESIWKSMGNSVEKLYRTFKTEDNKSELNIIRTRLADKIYDFSKKYDKGAYKLDMPVGTGKTYAGLRYAIGNANQFKKRRVFYITAFLSVLEQNANSIRELLGNDFILEHHSNIIQEHDAIEEEQDKREYEIGEYLKESWETPIILTTLVQLSNTMFKGRAANIRRFSKLINSVIIIDEIQSLPTKAIYNFNLMMNFLAKIMNATIIHSTATPPGYDNEKVLAYPCVYGNNKESQTSIIEDIDGMDVFARVDYFSLLGENFDISFNSKDINSHIKEQLENEKSALIVLNTKKAVLNLYNELSMDEDIVSENVEIIYLTTNQCPAHRLEIINLMKKKLKKIRKSMDDRKMICISTKLVEAGVDIDFDMVYRSTAGVDSIIQSGGRCNREGEKASKGKVFVLDYDEENLNHLPNIKKQREASLTALRILQRKGKSNKTINMDEAVKLYFHKLYQNEEGSGNQMEYIIKDKDDTILNLLSNNINAKRNYETKNGKKINFKLRQSFKTAATEFELIKEDTINVIVQYKNEQKINKFYEFIEKRDFYNLKRVLQELQPYTIGIRNIQEYESYVTKEMDGEILILNKEAYDNNIGLNKGDLQPLLF